MTAAAAVLTVCVSTLSASLSLAQVDQAWVQTQEGQPARLLLAPDGDVILAASKLVPSTVSGAFYDSIIERYAPDGLLRWRWQSNESQDDRLKDIALDAQGNIYAVGRIGTSFWGQSPFATRVMKFSASGQRLWTSMFTPARAGFDAIPEGVRAAPDGSVTIFGQDYGAVPSNQRDLFIARYSGSGSHQWTFRRGGNNSDFVFDLTFDNASNAYWVGSTFRPGTELTGGCLGKLNPSGQQLWIWLQPVANNSGGWLSSVSLDHAGNAVGTGHAENFPGYQDGLIVKTDSAGVQLFSNLWDGPFAHWDRFFTHTILSDNSIVVSGDTYVSDGWQYYDVPTIRYSASGQLLWTDIFGSVLFAPDDTEEWSLNTLTLPGDHVLNVSSDWSRPGHDYVVSILAPGGQLVERAERQLANGDIKDIPNRCVVHDPARNAAYILGWGSGFAPNPIADHYALIRVDIPSTTPAACEADFNADGARNTLDLGIILGNFAGTVTPNTRGDIDGNGMVNTLDLTIFLAAFGVPCP